MVNVILKDGNRLVDPLWDTRPGIIEICRDMIRSRIPRLSCPTHKSASQATILVDVRPGNGSWVILDFCCEGFCRAIAQRMPYPSNRSRASRVYKSA